MLIAVRNLEELNEIYNLVGNTSGYILRDRFKTRIIQGLSWLSFVNAMCDFGRYFYIENPDGDLPKGLDKYQLIKRGEC